MRILVFLEAETDEVVHEGEEPRDVVAGVEVGGCVWLELYQKSASHR